VVVRLADLERASSGFAAPRSARVAGAARSARRWRAAR